jgi:hypothetical protein
MTANENSRVKIPCILHLNHLGYQYLSLKDAVWDDKTNIFTDILKRVLLKDNEEYFNREMMRLLIRQFNLQKINLNVEISRYINHLIVKEYLNEFNGIS